MLWLHCSPKFPRLVACAKRCVRTIYLRHFCQPAYTRVEFDFDLIWTKLGSDDAGFSTEVSISLHRPIPLALKEIGCLVVSSTAQAFTDMKTWMLNS